MTPNSNPRKVLVTGASGFLGGHVVQHFEDAGYQLGVLVLPGTWRGKPDSPNSPRVFAYTGSYESVRETVSDFHPDVVLHLASLFLPSHRSSDLDPLIAANITFGTYLLEAMAAARVRYLVNTGTSWQHYESAPYSPVCLYAATKQAFEDILRFYADSTGLQAVTLKLFDTYGPDDPRPKLLQLLLRTLRSGEPLKMSPGEQQIDYVHALDVARAFHHAARTLMSSGFPKSSYAVRSGSPISLRELVRKMETIAGRPLNVEFGALSYRPREIMTPWAGEVLPGWHPQIALDEGLRELLALQRE